MGSNISKSSPSDAISTKIQTLGKMFYNIVVHSEVLDVLRVVYEELVVSASTENALCLGRNMRVCVFMHNYTVYKDSCSSFSIRFNTEVHRDFILRTKTYSQNS